VAAALEQSHEFVSAGAQILDVGAESSRPSQFYGEHPPVSAEVEAALAVPVVAALVTAFRGRALVSIDTSKGAVARQALAAGATIVNDVWAVRGDTGTADAAAEAGAHLVLMHNKEVAEYPDGVFAEVSAGLAAAVQAAIAAGVPREHLIVDPGIGFGKTASQSIEILHRLAELKAALGGLPLLIGTSRKRVIGELLGGAAPDDRLEGTAASVALAIGAGADVVRVHDVAAIMKTVRVADGIVRWHS
jgi:dihydropteroate synthase